MAGERAYLKAGVVGTVVIAAVLRLAQLGAESLWLDEAYSVGIVQQRSYRWLLFEHPMQDPHPPLHYILVKGWTQVIGSSPVAVRLQSVLFGLGTVVIVYYLGRELFDARTGLYGALFVAIAPFHLWHSQTIRMYALVGFLTALATLALVWLAREYRLHWAGLYVLSAVALGYTHVFGFFVILAHILYLATRPLLPGETLSIEPQRWLTIQGVVGILLVPWAYALVQRAIGPTGLSSPRLSWIPRQDPSVLWDVIALFVSGLHIDTELDAAIPAGLPLVLGAVAGAFLVGALFRMDLPSARVIESESEWDRIKAGVSVEEATLPGLWLLGLVLAVPIAIPYILSVAVTPILVLRYTIPASIGFYLLVARGARKIRPPPIQVILIGILLVGLLVPLPAYYAADQKGQWQEAVQSVESRADEDDLVIVAPKYAWWPFGQYYRGGLTVRTADATTSQAQLRDWIRGQDRVFLVFRYPGQETRERFRGVLEAMPGRTLGDTQEFLDVTVVLYENGTVSTNQSTELKQPRSGSLVPDFGTGIRTYQAPDRVGRGTGTRHTG